MKQPESWNDENLFRLEYEQLSQSICARDNLTIIAGTILITASVLLLGTCTQLVNQSVIGFKTKISLISASLSIYTIWLVCFNLTSRMLNELSYNRLRNMEKSKIDKWKKPDDMKLHRYILEQIEETKWWKYLRRPVWLYFLWVLIMVSIAILLIPT